MNAEHVSQVQACIASMGEKEEKIRGWRRRDTAATVRRYAGGAET